MSGSFGNQQVSSFAPPNALFDAAQVAGAAQQYRGNQLLQQQTQQTLGAGEMDQMGRAAAGVLNVTDPAQRPAAYAAAVQNLQRNGFARNAPADYPGDAAMRSLAAQTISVPDQYRLGIITPPGTTAAINAALGGNQPAQGSQPPAGGTPAASGTIEPTALGNANAVRDGLIKRGMDSDTATAFAANALHESVANPNTGPGDGGASHGLFQWNGDRAAGFQAIYGHSPDNAPLDEQLDYVMHELNGPESLAKGRIAQAQGVDGKAAEVSQSYLRPKDVVPEMQRRSATALQLQRQIAQPGQGGQTTPPAAPATGQVVIGDSLASSGGLGGSGVVGASPSVVRAQIAEGVRNGAYTGKDVVLSSGASNAPGDMENVEAQLKQLRDAGSVTLLGVGPAVEAKNPGTNAALQKLAAQYGAKFQPLPADQMSPDGVHPTAAGYAALKTATTPSGASPQSGRYQVASNAPVAPPTPPPTSTAQPAQSPAPTAPPPVPTNAAAPGGANGPPAPAPAPAAGPQPNLPHAADVPTGANSPQFRQAQDLQRRAMILDAQPDPTGRLKTLAAGLRSQAALILQSDSVVQTQEGQVHVLTGAIDKTAAPLPNYVYSPTQHAYIDTTGTNKPEFEPAQRDTAVAQRDVMELGPKVANGSATPEEVARYNVAATTYQQPSLRENPVTKETVRVNTRELPPGFPQPSGAGTAGIGAGSNVVMPGLSTTQQEIERNPSAAKVADVQYDRDSKDIAGIADAGRQAQADQVRITQMQDVLQRFSSGAGTEARTAASAWLQRWLPSAITGWEKESANLSGADAAQEFQKLALTGAGAQERGVLGNRGGFQAIKLFKDANPNVNLQDTTNKSILDMQLINNQANQDYSQAALSHFADNETKYAQVHQYTSLAQFDRSWNSQRNPQVYAAAMGAVAGQQPEQWAKGLSDDEYARALKVVENAKPGAVVNGKSGRIVVQPPTATPPPGFTVVPQ